MSKTLYIIGTPLDETGTLQSSAVVALTSCTVILGESRKNTLRLFAHSGLRLPEERFIFLDHAPKKEEIENTLSTAFRNSHNVALLSDSGMPILFDPGGNILQIARDLGFAINTIPAATSWGTACALSGFGPPFLIYGFLPQKTPERIKALNALKPLTAHLVLLDTPYRFHSLLANTIQSFGNAQEAFLAWEIGRPGEWYGWGALGEIKATAERSLPKKGEFILILRALRS